MVPPWFAAPLAEGSLGAAARAGPRIQPGTVTGASRQGLGGPEKNRLHPCGSETIFRSLFPARFHRPGSLEGTAQKRTLLFTANLMISRLLYAKGAVLSTESQKFFPGRNNSAQKNPGGWERLQALIRQAVYFFGVISLISSHFSFFGGYLYFHSLVTPFLERWGKGRRSN